MTKRQNIATGTVWEGIHGYSRVVRVGQHVFVAGTTATDDNGQLVGPDDPYAQTIFIIQKIERALVQVGASLQDVVRTRLFITDVSRWEEVSRAHGEFFKDIRPVSTLVEVSALIGPGYLVEIEAEALIAE
jgi:enamine deaminase RidA (YjgF/YER057c/UK114 family)